MKQDYKKELIKMVNELSIDKEFWENMKGYKRAGKEGKLGSSNIRSVAGICENAECYEEVRLYIEYKIGKGNGWNERIKVKESNNKLIPKVFGRAVIEHMDRIYHDFDGDDRESLNAMSLYFGYMFWRKVAIENGDYEYKAI